ncbi:hypothetical protein GCM10023231_02300 [Olivibacter ginsenosidimutans]|uniref:Uncharacterized protein n=1 Tax=Olivibacter ginsenosidimutans TaxID=1176537 RepID=A0ABP9AE77_9SPHI
MKRRGKLSLINHTAYDWIKTYQKNYRMASWHFPEIIPANCTVDVEIEWQKTPQSWIHLEDGQANYVLFGSRDRSFQIKASSQGGYGIQIYFSNLITKQFPLGSTINLEWKNDEGVQFKLAGMADEFYNESKESKSLEETL